MSLAGRAFVKSFTALVCLAVSFLLLSPAAYAQENSKGLLRAQPPLITPEPKLKIASGEASARILSCAQRSSLLARSVQEHILSHLKAADSYDVETFRKNDDELNDLYEQSDANLLEWQMIVDALELPGAASLQAARTPLKSAKLNSYKSSAIFYLCFGQPVSSAHCARLALSIAEANPDQKTQLGDLYFYSGCASFWSGDYQKAENELKQCLENEPDNSYATYYLGDLYIAQKKEEQAIAWLERAAAQAPTAETRGHLHRALAFAYALSNQQQPARHQIELAKTELNSPATKELDPLADESLGVVAALAGQYDQADRHLTRSLVGLERSPIQRGNRLEAAQASLWRSYCRERLGQKATASADRQYALSFADEASHLHTLKKHLDHIFGFTESSTPVAETVHDRWAMVVGVSQFADPQIHYLHYPAKDAQDLEQFLIAKAGFKPDHIKTLLNSNATRAAITDCLAGSWLPAVTHPGDLVFVFISSHGTPAYKELGASNSVVTYDTSLDHLFTTSMPMQSIVRMVRSKLKKRHAFVILDTCYAGGLGAPGAITASNADPDLLVSSAYQLLVSSSDCNERSWESKRYQNAVFTRQLIETLEQNPQYQDFHNIFTQLRNKVSQEVLSDFANKQTPLLAGHWSGRGLLDNDARLDTQKTHNSSTTE